MATNNTEDQPIKLTPSQQRAYDRFLQFLKDDTKVFILKGYAGTGKTTLLKTFINDLEKMKEPFKLLASTGRAAKIMRDITGRTATTIHSQLYTFKDLNTDLDELYENNEKKTKMDEVGQLLLDFEAVEVDNTNYKRCFYIVDESSMIGDMEEKNPTQATFGSGQTLTDLLKFDSKGKFIFVGDSCQLPPVKEKESPALSSWYIKNRCLLTCMEAELTEIVRQDDDNDITIAAGEIRKILNVKEQPRFARFPILGFEHIDVFNDKSRMMRNYVDDISRNGYEYATLISRSNKEISVQSAMVRAALGKQGNVTVDDLLMVTQNNYISGLTNGDQVVVKEVGNIYQQAGMTFQQIEVEELASKRRVKQLILLDVLYSASSNISQEQQKRLLIDFHDRMYKQGIKQKSQAFKQNMLEDPFLNSIRANFGYVITCHKSQGGEWTNVYIDMPRFLPPGNAASEYQWMYTAMTRAKNMLFVNDSIGRTFRRL